MNRFTSGLIVVVFFISCQPKPGDTTANRLRNENFILKRENDSLRQLIKKSASSIIPDTIGRLVEYVSSKNNYPSFTGHHAITLQWIGWNDPGNAIIEETSNGWYKISGSQYSKNKQNYLKISGRIKPLNNRELEFDGQIESRVDSVNNGKPCIKNGKQQFKADGSRKYWRLQDMVNCEGNLVTDYIDIYF